MIKIENFEIGRHRTPFVIAEMSGNHNQSLERALESSMQLPRRGAWAEDPDVYAGYHDA